MQSGFGSGTSSQSDQEDPNLEESPAEPIEDRIVQRQSMVFEEIVIVINADDFASQDRSISAQKVLYEDLMGFLNTATESVLRDVKEQHGIVGEKLIQPLTSGDRRPVVLLDRKGQGGTAILFYELALKPVPIGTSPADRSLPIRKIATAINDRLVGHDDGRSGQWQIDAATPNWLATAASDDSGSPAAPPKSALVPVDAPRKWSFLFTPPDGATREQTDLQERVKSQRDKRADSNVIVAILDTCPNVTTEDLANAFDKKNQLLLEVAGQAGVLRKPIEIEASVPARFTQVQGVVPSWLGWLRLYFAAAPDKVSGLIGRYAIPSHGLFTAGIVKDIVPNARIRLIGMLNNVGMSSLDVLADIIEGLPGLREEGQNLIVNLSWTTSTLPADMDEDSHYLHVLQELIEWLGEKNVLVVAAAGNNALDLVDAAGNQPIGDARPAPRHPAAFAMGHVLSVAATEIRSENAAKYSNKASANGVATVGGDAFLNHGKSQIEIEPSTSDLDAINGIYLESTLAITGVENKTGWVSWAGTSFATPIISSVAAALWATDSSLHTPAEVIAEVRRHATIDTRAELNAKAIYVRQEILPKIA